MNSPSNALPTIQYQKIFPNQPAPALSTLHKARTLKFRQFFSVKMWLIQAHEHMSTCSWFWSHFICMSDGLKI